MTGPASLMSLTNPFFPVFPTNHPTWTIFTGTVYPVEVYGIVPYDYQQLGFVGTDGSLQLTLGNPFPNQTCTMEVWVQFSTATSFTVLVQTDTTLLGSTTVSNASAWTRASLTFTSPASGNMYLITGPGYASGAGVGIVRTTSWSVFLGTSLNAPRQPESSVWHLDSSGLALWAQRHLAAGFPDRRRPHWKNRTHWTYKLHGLHGANGANGANWPYGLYGSKWRYRPSRPCWSNGSHDTELAYNFTIIL